MLDLGTSFVASVARDPDAVAIVDADLRLTYAQWFARISSVVAAFDDLDLRPGDHIVTVLQNRWEAATIHWACQLAGIVITPINWRVKSDELDFCIENSEAKALVYESVSAGAVAGARLAHDLRRVVVGEAAAIDDHSVRFATLIDTPASEAAPRVGPEAWSIMLYTSGTTSRPKGVPRRHRAERAAGIAHVAQHWRSSRPKKLPTSTWFQRFTTIWFIIRISKRRIQPAYGSSALPVRR
jgi:2-furoate---CoA ligase